MYSALDIANIFVNKGIQDGKPVTQLQLQKLVYFATGALLAYTNGRDILVKEPFLAWDYGPVVPQIYSRYKVFGSSPISESEVDVWNFIGKRYVDLPIFLNEKAQKIVDDTWNLLSEIDGLRLSAWTHNEGSAWDLAFKKGQNTPLKIEDIEKDFKPLLKNTEDDARRAATAN